MCQRKRGPDIGTSENERGIGDWSDLGSVINESVKGGQDIERFAPIGTIFSGLAEKGLTKDLARNSGRAVQEGRETGDQKKKRGGEEKNI